MSDPVSKVHCPSGREEDVNVNSGLLLPWGPLDGSEQHFRLSSPLPERQVQVPHQATLVLSLFSWSLGICVVGEWASIYRKLSAAHGIEKSTSRSDWSPC